MRAVWARPHRFMGSRGMALSAAILVVAALPVFGTVTAAQAVPPPPTPPQLTTLTPSVNVGNTSVGQSSNPFVITLGNSGGTADVVTGATYGGADPNDFFVFPFVNPNDNNNCTIDQNTGAATIPPNGTCDLILGFVPGAFGPRSATTTLLD